MASKSGQDTTSIQQIEELLDAVTLTIERLKTLYEQYFLGIQKQAPAFIHNDVERKLRDLTQLNIRNTGLRYRLATLQQKFGSYNAYWRRTLRQIENGTYLRNLAKIGRDAARNGADIPEEILAAMPKRMREQVLRDRDQAIAVAKRRNMIADGVAEDGLLELADGDLPPPLDDDAAAMIDEPSVLKRELKTRTGAHVVAEDDADMDFDAFFSAFDDDAPKAPASAPAPAQIARIAPVKVPQTQTQAITQPIPRGVMAARLRLETEPDAPALDFDDADTPPARTPTPTALPARSSQTVLPTQAIRRPTAPGIPVPGQPVDPPPDAQATQALRRPSSPAIPQPGDPAAARRPSSPAIPQPGDPVAARRPSAPSLPQPPADAQPTTTIRRPTAPGVPQPGAPAAASGSATGMPRQTSSLPRAATSPGFAASESGTAIPRAGDSGTMIRAGESGTMPRAGDSGGFPRASESGTAIPRASESGTALPRATTAPGSGGPAPTSAIPRPIVPTPAVPRPVVPSPNATGSTSAMPRVPAPGNATGPTSAMPRVPAPGNATGPTSAIPRPVVPSPTTTTAIPRPPGAPVAGRQTGPVPVVGRQTGPVPTVGGAGRESDAEIPAAQRPQPIPKVAPSQASRPNPIAPGAAAKTGPVGVESMNGPFPRPQTPPSQPAPRPQTQAVPKPATAAPPKPPPGMTEADVNALHAKYVKAKEAVGEKVDPNSREKLLKTISQTAPKVMEQYKASGVDFSVVVKDNQVVIKAKPKT